MPFQPTLASLILVASASAQQFVDIPVRDHFPAVQYQGIPGMVAGDVTGNGFPDIALENQLFINDGFGRFSDETATRFATVPGQPLACADLDGDGDLDLLTQPFALLANDGTGVFSDVTARFLPTGVTGVLAAHAADADGDGDLDLFVGLDNGPVRLFDNHIGVFTDVTATRMPTVAILGNGLAYADFDGDGDHDLVVGAGRTGYWVNSAQQNRLYLNDGSGSFTDATAGRMPSVFDSTSGVAAADFDGDGDLDLVFSNDFHLSLGGPAPSEATRIYQNDGAGRFTDISTTAPGGSQFEDVVVLDFDADGDTDIVLSSGTMLNSIVLTNDGTGLFAAQPRAVFARYRPRCSSMLVLDANGDGLDDLLVAGNGVNSYGCPGDDGIETLHSLSRLYQGVGGSLRDMSGEPRLQTGPDPTTAIAVGDVNGDGHVDLLLGKGNLYSGSSISEPNQLLLGSVTGDFPISTPLVANARIDDTVGLLLGDVDADGDLDAFECVRGEDRLFLNDGLGMFTDVTGTVFPLVLSDTEDAVVFDTDGDGDLEIVTVGPGGMAIFDAVGGPFVDVTATRGVANLGSANGITAIDFTADGHTDLAITLSSKLLLFPNDGAGNFTTLRTLASLRGSRFFGSQEFDGLTHTDVDGDGDQDLIAGVWSRRFSSFGSLMLLINDGEGFFEDESSTRLPLGLAPGVVAADVDRDGDIDLVSNGNYTCPNPIPILVQLNDGQGVFADDPASTLGGVLGDASALALADIDHDGDPDLVIGRPGDRFGGPGDSIVPNVLSHLSAPFDATPGAGYVLAIRVQPGNLVSPRTAYTVGAFALAANGLPIPQLGMFFLDVGSTFSVGVQGIAAPDGVARVELTLPPLPSLVGATAHFQSLVVDPANSADAHFSNVVSETVR